MANGKLYITITDDREGGNGTPTPNPVGSEKKDDTLGRYVEHEMFHLVKQQALQAVNYSLANIGNFTGNYTTQRKVNEAKQVISGVMRVGMSTIAGAKYGWVGAVVGFVAGSASLVADTAYSVNSDYIENRKSNYEIQQLRERSGLNAAYDGSRGTEN